MILIPAKIIAANGKPMSGVFDADNAFCYITHPINPEHTMVVSSAGHEIILAMPLAYVMQVINEIAAQQEEDEGEEEIEHGN
jgi:hypothetical protein